MTHVVYRLDPERLTADADEAEETGRRFAETYQSARPYPHICIDDFLPLPVVEKVREEALAKGAKAAEHESAQEHLKASYNPETLPLYTRAVFGALNAPSFLRFLEAMTGIEHLIPDPYYLGAGIHRTNTGGYLNIHADFNKHKRMNLERRLNVLIYLNPDWQPEYGGAFEVWTEDMKECAAQFPPVMNRMCCFSTTSTSYHGNPQPVNHPNGDPRLSIALYYYTPTWLDGKLEHSTLFRVRPGTGDKAVRQIQLRSVMQEVLPPVLYRSIAGLRRR